MPKDYIKVNGFLNHTFESQNQQKWSTRISSKYSITTYLSTWINKVTMFSVFYYWLLP